MMPRSVFVLTALLGILLIKSYAEAAKCNCQCPFNYDPICAADSSGLEDTYPNRCAMECYKCTQDEVLVIRHKGECVGNSLSPTNLQETKKKTNQKTTCNCKCPFNYDPICAADSSGLEDTYPNKCAMECYKCTNDEVLVIRNKGECVGNSLSPTNLQATNKKPNQKRTCNCQCPFNYDPVCAVDSKGVEETYPNLCSLKCYTCTHGKELKIRKQGECEHKSGNQANTRSMNMISKTKTQTSSSKCNCKCPLNYAPVCAADPKGVEETFPNQCAFQCYECTVQKGFVIRKQGECSSKTVQRPNLPPSRNTNIQKKPTVKCNCKCPHNYDPVCITGASGTVQEFQNNCAFECEKCIYGEERWKKGDCKSMINSATNRKNSNVKCKCACTSNYIPVCAVNSRGAEETFPNRCSLDCYNCTHDKDYVPRRMGECSQSNSSKSHRPPSRTA